MERYILIVLSLIASICIAISCFVSRERHTYEQGYAKGYEDGYNTADKWCTTWNNLSAADLKAHQEKHAICKEIVKMVGE